jgi:hypothetical protein
MSTEKININDYAWQNLTTESAKVILDQLEKNLSASIETAKILTDRAVTVLQFSIPIILALIGVIFSQPSQILIHLSVVGILFLIIISWKALSLYELYQIQPLGNTLENLLSKEKIDCPEEQQEFAFIYNSILSVNDSIIFNDNSNKNRQTLMRSIIFWIKVGSLVIIIYSALWFPVFQSLFEAWG